MFVCVCVCVYVCVHKASERQLQRCLPRVCVRGVVTQRVVAVVIVVQARGRGQVLEAEARVPGEGGQDARGACVCL